MGRKKILMIAYHFPPLGGAGALRPMKMAKYLPVYGWNPIILTIKNPDWYYARDDRLLREIQSEMLIIRTFMLRSAWLYRILNPLRIRKLDIFLRRYLVHPDDQIGWFPFAVRAASGLIEKDNIDAVYSTSAPLTAHLIAYHICRRFGIPWIADFRDEWFENPGLSLPTAFHRRLHYRLEGLIVNSAQQVIAAAPVFGRYLAKHCPDNPKFETITMGFDPDDYRDPGGASEQRKGKFTLTFSGLFYGSFRPDHLLKALNTLIEAGKIQRETVCLRFIGANFPHDLREPDKYGVCEFTGFLPHDEALHLARQSDVLLLLLSRERGKDVIPSKTFEYMALKKPVLALVPDDGVVARIVLETGIGMVADFDDTHAIMNAYFNMYQQWLNDTLKITPNLDKIREYSHINLTSRFASLLDKMTKKPLRENP
jgi:glycosyltransferase involved in cell wall biosynthesis